VTDFIFEAKLNYVVPLESSNELRFNKKEWKASNVLHAVKAISNPYLTHYHTGPAKSIFCTHPATKYSTTTQQHAPTFFKNKMLWMQQSHQTHRGRTQDKLALEF